jgi:hypothetical protein
MKEDPGNNRQVKRVSSWKAPVIAAAILAVIQACLTVEGMGVEGFVLWVLILFVGYWLLIMILRWIWQKFQNRT